MNAKQYREQRDEARANFVTSQRVVRHLRKRVEEMGGDPNLATVEPCDEELCCGFNVEAQVARG